MDDLISEFISENFSYEAQDEIKRSFGLFDSFEHDTAYQGFIDMIMNESNLDRNSMVDMFNSELHTQLNFILTHHSVTMIDTSTIYEKNEILSAFSNFQYLEDYTSIIRTLENLDADEVQLSSILTDLCMLDQFKIMELIQAFNPRLLKTMKKFIYKKEESDKKEGFDNDPKLLKNLKLFNKVFGAENLGAQLVRGQLIVGEKFETYINYIQESVIGVNDTLTATNILSTIYLSSDGFNSPLLVYRKYSYELLQDLDKVGKIETQILSLIATMEEHRNAEAERARNTQTNIAAN